MNETYLFFGILVACVATFTTRIIPFVLFAKKEPSPWLKYIEIYLPVMIMIVLVFYALKDVKFLLYPFGMPELIGIFVAIVIHLMFKHALLSIISSTVVYMLIIQNYL